MVSNSSCVPPSLTNSVSHSKTRLTLLGHGSSSSSSLRSYGVISPHFFRPRPFCIERVSLARTSRLLCGVMENSTERGKSMKKLLVAAALFLPIALTACSHPRPVAYYPPPPPPAWTEIARQGFHDGVEAGRRDVAAGRSPDAERHPRFRRPPVSPPAWEDYRHGFREGYRGVFEHGGSAPGSY